MKRTCLPMIMAFAAMMLATGCAWHVAGGTNNVTVKPTAGQQLIDLQKARESGAITDAEYQAQKAKVLEGK